MPALRDEDAFKAGVLAGAEWCLMREFRTYVKTMPEAEIAVHFDGRNRDMWMRSFAEFLARPREFASND
jgi:hypothetical protein